MADPNTNFNQLLSTTLYNYRPKMEDNIRNNTFFFYWMNKKGRFMEEPGGERIVVPLMYSENDTVQSYSDYDVLDTTAQTGITSAEYEWKAVSGSIVISGMQKFKNSGQHQQINLMKAKIEQCEISIGEQLNRMMFSDGTGNAGKDPAGLGLMCEGSAQPSSTVGNISSSTYSWWRNQVAADESDTGAFGNTASGVGLVDMHYVYNRCRKGANACDLIVAGQTAYEKYEMTLDTAARYYDKTAASAGFDVLKFKNAAVGWDEDAAAGDMFFVNTKYLTLTVGKGMNFHATPFQRPPKQDALVSHIFWYGNLCTSNRQRLGRLAGIT